MPRCPRPHTPHDTTRRAARHGLLACVLACALAPVAAAVTPATLVHPDLHDEPIHLIGLDRTSLSYFDANRIRRVAPIDRFVQVRAIGGRTAHRPEGAAFLELTDGQALAGQWGGADDDDSHLRWEHPALGTVRVPLTAITRVRLGDQPIPTPDPEVGDVLVLGNGDRMTGFVESIGAQTIRFTPNDAGQPLDLPTDRLAGLSLANPPATDPHERYRVTLDDGSRIAATRLALHGQTLTLTPTAMLGDADTPSPITLPLQTLVRIDAPGSGMILRELNAIPMRLADGGQVFGVPMPPRAHDHGLTLHAPATVRFDLPDGAARLTATIRLDLPRTTHHEHRSFAHCTLTIRHGNAADATRTLTFSTNEPEARINLPLADGILELTLGEGDFGPILDRLHITDAVLLIETDKQ